MTRSDILSLAPGPALDAAMAEHVMGWKRVEVANCWRGCWLRPDRLVEFCVPEWSRTWAGAGQVVERMVELDWNLELNVLTHPERSQAQFWRRGGPGAAEGYQTSGWTPPLLPVPEAVCKAALLAVLAPASPREEAGVG